MFPVVYSQALNYLFDQSEVWSSAIVLLAWGRRRKQPVYMQLVGWYFILGFLMYLVGNIKADFSHRLDIPGITNSNTMLYNVHSMVRFVFFALFFKSLQQRHYKRLRTILPLLLLLYIVADIIVSDFMSAQGINSRLFTIEAFLLLMYCMLYYLSELKEDKDYLWREKHFWVVTGLGFYVAINFFVFLNYYQLYDVDSNLADGMWDIHNVAHIIFCLLTANAFYVNPRK